ncbi:hypothetical protein [Microbacterium sp. PMB16]|uniref:hypothetical protein n=1 Tax=Microbacterium sp. PMB16 TaxID=3120157 RepID=UPI003F4C8ED8
MISVATSIEISIARRASGEWDLRAGQCRWISRGGTAGRSSCTLSRSSDGTPAALPFGHGEALAWDITGARLIPLAGMGHQMPPPVLWRTVVPAILSISGGQEGTGSPSAL